jgi:hypothetical protein
MWASSTDNTIEAFQKVLGEPMATGLSDRAWKVRTQLMAVSVVAIGLVNLGLHVNRDATVFGFSLSGLTDAPLRQALGIWIAYLIVHFVWMAWESFAEWRLRLTGTRVASVTAGTFAAEGGDYPSDPRQSTLGNWWRQEAAKIGNLTELIDRLERTLAEKEPLNQITLAASQLRQAIQQTAYPFTSLRIPASLDRFERAYVHFLKVQNVRWLLLDVLLPLVVALIALSALWSAGHSVPHLAPAAAISSHP